MDGIFRPASYPLRPPPPPSSDLFAGCSRRSSRRSTLAFVSEDEANYGPMEFHRMSKSEERHEKSFSIWRAIDNNGPRMYKIEEATRHPTESTRDSNGCLNSSFRTHFTS
ncbi:hypothetical protein HDE_08545 [Halotydeus destructor]|nr:hypothetical protein HDE_08545 [Halotydeus destructor]